MVHLNAKPSTPVLLDLLPYEYLQPYKDPLHCTAAPQMFGGPILAKVAGSLAAEFEILCSTTPGHFAVLRSGSVTANGLLQRPLQRCSMSARVCKTLAAPRASSGVASLSGPKAASMRVSGEAITSSSLLTAPALLTVLAADDALCAGSLNTVWRPSAEFCRRSPRDMGLFTSPRGVCDECSVFHLVPLPF